MSYPEDTCSVVIKKNQREFVCISMQTWKNQKRVDIRIHAPVGPSADIGPTRMGVSVPVDQYDQLKDAILRLEEMIPATQEVCAGEIRLDNDRLVKITASTYRGHPLFSVREYRRSGTRSDTWHPTKQGVSLNVDMYAELRRAVIDLGEIIGEQPIPEQGLAVGLTSREDTTKGQSEELADTESAEDARGFIEKPRKLSKVWNELRVGMYVRVPVDYDRVDEIFRDFRIGMIKGFDEETETVTVSLNIHYGYKPPEDRDWEFDIRNVVRCRIVPDTDFVHLETGQHGRLLISVEDEIPTGAYVEYYVLFNGQIEKMPESELKVSCIRMDSDPVKQMKRYEFNNPIWRPMRDRLIEIYSELDNATYGIRELVGSRVVLLEHQAQVVSEVLGDERCRYLLADEVGLGKTIEALVILKALLARNSRLKSILVVPGSIIHQWENELQGKFWLSFSRASNWNNNTSGHGLMVSFEELLADLGLQERVAAYPWDLAIVDEAHNLQNDKDLLRFCLELSSTTPRVLILSATPILRRASEYLALLRLLDPARYGSVPEEQFDEFLEGQSELVKAVAFLSPVLTLQKFDPEEFVSEVSKLAVSSTDDVCAGMMSRFNDVTDPEKLLGLAKEILSYISENYRLERRVIRNRRTHLHVPFPERRLNTNYQYHPHEIEVAALQDLYVFCQRMIQQSPTDPIVLEQARLLLHSASSSPSALLGLLRSRADSSKMSSLSSENLDISRLVQPASFRDEDDRRMKVMAVSPTRQSAKVDLDVLIWRTQAWQDREHEVENSLSPTKLKQVQDTRIGACLQAMSQMVDEKPSIKILVFASFHSSLDILVDAMKLRFGSNSIELFVAGRNDNELQEAANRFQADPRCRFLVCDELGGEGRNLQVADAIIHFDTPWAPSQIEQRIGRVDRVGREGTVESVVLTAKGTLEESLFEIWNDAFHLFTESMSGMEIMLEGVQDDLLGALEGSVETGLHDLVPEMVRRAEQLREYVEEERYFEERTINRNLGDQISEISDTYDDGEILRKATLAWLKECGLVYTYDKQSSVVEFNPKDFDAQRAQMAKYLVPNMEEALRHSQNRRAQTLKGTYNRILAIRREDLIFFSPVDEPWTEAIISNAQEADRGRCSAVLRESNEIDHDWSGFEFFYSISVNPRPLFEQGYDPSNLVRAQGYLVVPTLKVMVSVDGDIVKQSDPIWRLTEMEYPRIRAQNLGKHMPTDSDLERFMEIHPRDLWAEVVSDLSSVTDNYLRSEFSFSLELAEEARAEFDRTIRGQRASERWIEANLGLSDDRRTSEVAADVYDCLVRGIANPIFRLESLCYWELKCTR